jgi:hypothetical protein
LYGNETEGIKKKNEMQTNVGMKSKKKSMGTKKVVRALQ